MAPKHPNLTPLRNRTQQQPSLSQSIVPEKDKRERSVLLCFSFSLILLVGLVDSHHYAFAGLHPLHPPRKGPKHFIETLHEQLTNSLFLDAKRGEVEAHHHAAQRSAREGGARARDFVPKSRRQNNNNCTGRSLYGSLSPIYHIPNTMCRHSRRRFK